MLWSRGKKDIQKLEAELKELHKQVKKLKSQNQQLSGQVTVFKAARDFMNLLFYKIPACVIITDNKGRIMKASQHMQDLIETSESALVGKYTVEICARVDDLVKSQEHAFERKTSKQDVRNFESCLLHRNGTEVPVSSDITFVQDETGNNVGAVAVVHPRQTDFSAPRHTIQYITTTRHTFFFSLHSSTHAQHSLGTVFYGS